MNLNNGKAPYVGRYIGWLRSGERLLADAFLMVANRQERDSEVRDMCKQLAEESKRHGDILTPLAKRYGEHYGEEPERVRSALFHGVRIGGLGKLQDLQDLALLGNHVKLAWSSLVPAAGTLHDRDMELACSQALAETNQQIAWLQAQIEQTASQALAVAANKSDALTASLPKTPMPAALQEIVWSPLSGGFVVFLVGLIGWAAGQPWLLPSLGPTAYLQAEMPAHPSAKLYHVVVGHLVGLAAGFVAVALCQAWQEPIVLIDHELTLARTVAAAIALLLTLVGCLLLKASHPPAGATALLVALGSIVGIKAAVNVAIGAVIIGALGEGLRRVRMQGALPRTS
jgi:hypothetical protein